MVQVITERPARPIPESESVAGVDDGDGGNDWEPDTTTGIPPGVDPGDVLTWDGDSWEPEAPAASTREWELWDEGGDPQTFAIGAMGATQTIDAADGNRQTATVDDDCTITVTTTAVAGDIEVWFTWDGDGHVLTFDGVAQEFGAPDPTDGNTSIAVISWIDTGATYVVAWIGGGSSASAITVKDEGSDLTTSPTSIDFVGAGVTASTVGDDVTVTIPGVTEAAVRDIGHWEVVVSGSAPPVAVSTPSDDDWVYAWVPG